MKNFNTFVVEDLRKWFSKTDPSGDWKRINSKGEAIGPCAREPGEPKPKCMSAEKRASLTKKERASAVAAKRKHDPNPERKGEPINVSNFGKGKISESAAAAIAAATAISKKKSGNYDKEGLRVKPYKNPDAPNAKSNEQRKKEMKEDTEQLDEKNVPTNPELWSRAKSLARSKFDVYPSAYANGWASKWYKGKGGGWKSVSEETEMLSFKSFVAERCWPGYKSVPGKKAYSLGSCVKEDEAVGMMIKGAALNGLDDIEIADQIAARTGGRVAEMDNRTTSGDREEQRKNRPEEKAKQDKEQQQRLKDTSPEMRKKLRLPEPKEGVAEGTLDEQIDEVAAWQRKEGKSEAGGLNRKGIESYRRENPGSKLSMAVTTEPSKLKPGSKSANRRKSFCARMGGMKKRLTSDKTANDPDSRINKALRKWNC